MEFEITAWLRTQMRKTLVFHRGGDLKGAGWPEPTGMLLWLWVGWDPVAGKALGTLTCRAETPSACWDPLRSAAHRACSRVLVYACVCTHVSMCVHVCMWCSEFGLSVITVNMQYLQDTLKLWEQTGEFCQMIKCKINMWMWLVFLHASINKSEESWGKYSLMLMTKSYKTTGNKHYKTCVNTVRKKIVKLYWRKYLNAWLSEMTYYVSGYTVFLVV